jgi:hypothetical protein
MLRVSARRVSISGNEGFVPVAEAMTLGSTNSRAAVSHQGHQAPIGMEKPANGPADEQSCLLFETFARAEAGFSALKDHRAQLITILSLHRVPCRAWLKWGRWSPPAPKLTFCEGDKTSSGSRGQRLEQLRAGKPAQNGQIEETVAYSSMTVPS